MKAILTLTTAIIFSAITSLVHAGDYVEPKDPNAPTVSVGHVDYDPNADWATKRSRRVRLQRPSLFGNDVITIAEASRIQSERHSSGDYRTDELRSHTAREIIELSIEARRAEIEGEIALTESETGQTIALNESDADIGIEDRETTIYEKESESDIGIEDRETTIYEKESESDIGIEERESQVEIHWGWFDRVVELWENRNDG